MEKRFFVLKGIKLKSGDFEAGVYLPELEAESLGEKGLSRLVRLSILFDITGKTNLPRLDGDKRRKRLRYLSAIGTDESKKVLEILESQDDKVRIVYNERASQRSAARKRTALGLPPVEEKIPEPKPKAEPKEKEEPFTPLSPSDVLSNPKPKSGSKGRNGRKQR